MATPIVKDKTLIAVKREVTEGTYVAPSAGADFIQVITDGWEIVPAKELIDRDVLTSSIGKVTPRTGIKSATATLPIEMKASGTEGDAPEYGLLIEEALGGSRTIAAQNTTKAAGNTATVLQIEDADIGDYSVGDGIIVLEPGDHTPSVITAVDPTGGSANITVSPGRASGSFSASVVISESQVYYPSNTGHDNRSKSHWYETN